MASVKQQIKSGLLKGLGLVAIIFFLAWINGLVWPATFGFLWDGVVTVFSYPFNLVLGS